MPYIVYDHEAEAISPNEIGFENNKFKTFDEAMEYSLAWVSKNMINIDEFMKRYLALNEELDINPTGCSILIKFSP